MTTTDHTKSDSTATQGARLPEAEVTAALARLASGAPGAALEALRLAEAIERRPLLEEGADRQDEEEREARLEAFAELADRLRLAIGRCESADPRVLLAKAEILARWPAEGTPAWADDLTRTLRAGLATLAGAGSVEGARHD